MSDLQRASSFFTRTEIDALRRVNNWRAVWLVAHCWLVIFGTWAVCLVWTNPLTILLGIMVVGARQLGLAILNHDAAHSTLFSHRGWNDWAGEWLVNRPMLGASVLPYRKYHLQHHRFTQQAEDPDLSLSAPFPISGSSYRRKLWRDLSGQTGIQQRWATIRGAFGKPGDPVGQRLRRGAARLGPNLAINLVFLSIFWLAGAAYLYVLLWIVPMLTWHMVITRLRNIGEHAAVPDDNDRLRNTRTVLVSPLERALICPYWVNYHLEHHLLVSAPCYRLPEAHRLLVAKGLLPQMEVRNGYLAVLRLATARPAPAGA